ncbi:MAG: hypothetical protein KDD69_11685 [Bdellovibrionales bacterium]|nr:hypothetical protein [Bdellovibrionales bacterium]
MNRLSYAKLLLSAIVSVYCSNFSASAEPTPSMPEDIYAAPDGPPPVSLTECPPEGFLLSLNSVETERRISSYYFLRPRNNEPNYPSYIQQGAVTFEQAGWYDVYHHAAAESGASQRNESFYMQVKNQTAPAGESLYANCGDSWIVRDSNNIETPPPGTLLYSGTFWFDTTANTVAFQHYCPLYRAGICQEFHDGSFPRSTCDYMVPSDPLSHNSVHVNMQEFCFVPRAAPAPTPPSDPMCDLFRVTIQHNDTLPVEDTQNRQNIEWLGEGPHLSCLSDHVQRAIDLCNPHTPDQWWGAWDDCVVKGYFMNATGYVTGEYRSWDETDTTVHQLLDPLGVQYSIDSPGLEPDQIECFGQVYENYSDLPETCLHYPTGGTWYFDSSCNAVNFGANDKPTDACDQAVLSWFGSPISLLWEPGTDIEADVVTTTFPLNPTQSGKVYTWKASAAAPLLVHDPRRTGQITSAHQLFGEWTFGGKSLAMNTARESRLDSGEVPLGPWKNGYEALATLDTNRDGRISGQELNELSLWFDRNRDGVSQDGEVNTVQQMGVTSLFYNHDRVDPVTRSVHAKRGFERVEQGRVIRGSSVDWYGEEADSTAALAIKNLARSAVSGMPDVEGLQSAAQELRVDPPTVPFTFAGESAPSLSGIWKWEAEEKKGSASQRYSGILTLAHNNEKLRGHSILEVPLAHKKAPSMMNLFTLDGKTERTEEGSMKLHFTLKDKGVSTAVSEAFVMDSQTLWGKTISASKVNGQQIRIEYTWRATRISSPASSN